MNIHLLSAVESVAETVTNQPTITASFWSATNIVVTILVGLITAIVTWKAAKANVNERSLSYSLKIHPILNSKFPAKEHASWQNIRITYNNVVLTNPCLVSLEIINTGNKGIENPPILVSNKENIEMIPLEVENIPTGYIWCIESDSSVSCKVSASLINPKQKLRASFFMSANPQQPLDFSCAMCDLQCHEITGTDVVRENVSIRTNIPYSVLLGGFAILLLLIFQSDVMRNLSYFFLDTFRVPAIFFELYVIAIPIVALFLSYLVPYKLNIWISRHRFASGIICLVIFFLASFLLYIILNDIWIYRFNVQLIIGIISVILYSSVLHLCHYMKK